VLGIADSAFNAAELAALGCPATVVVPILVDLGGGRMDGETVDQAELARLSAGHGDASVLLFVGRISPNKSHEHLLGALWVYRHLYDPDARLHLVGPEVTPDYAAAVFAYADELGLAGAVRHGQRLSAGELAAWYEDADVFVCLSRHEGFCIPLLEAMRAGTPIVALDAGAVGETLADAGILLPTARPATVAAAVDRVRSDPVLAERLVASGRRRLADFAAATTRRRFVDVLGRVAACERVVA
jgi:glycosyltransferase involved in cell wall biosynthesis